MYAMGLNNFILMSERNFKEVKRKKPSNTYDGERKNLIKCFFETLSHPRQTPYILWNFPYLEAMD